MQQNTWVATIYVDGANRRQPQQVKVTASSLIDAKLEIRAQYGTGPDRKPRPIEYQHGPVEQR